MRKSTSSASAAEQQVAVCYREISDLILDARNPRLHSPKQVRQIARSIQAFGFVVPVLIDARLKVVAGHGRVMACKLLGRSQVPTISLDHLSETQIRAFAIADNRLTENSEWNDRLLAEQLRELAVLDLDFDLEATGFEMAEIDLRIEGLTSESEDADLADAIPQMPSGPAVSRPGDLWLLGDHRVYCGSALDDRAYQALMGEERGAIIFSDPPYNVRIRGNVTRTGRHREFVMGSGEMSSTEFQSFLTRSLSLLAKYSREGSLHFICIDWRHLAEMIGAGGQVYTALTALVVWVKSNGGMGSFYRSQHELIFVFKSGHGPHRNNIQLGRYGRNRTNVWHYEGRNAFAQSADGENPVEEHPTVKPTALVADAIVDCSARGEIVLDAFLGSGTTVVAAERTGRKCFAMELDPLYVDLAIRRWQDLKGDLVRHAVTGRTFNEVAAEAGERHGE